MRIESSFGTKESWKLPDARPWNKSCVCVCVFEHAYKYIGMRVSRYNCKL